jgi:hypothetical protein
VPVGVKILFTSFALLVLPFVLYAVRPNQRRAVGTRFWILGARDPVRRLIYRENGLPHSYTWKLALGWFAFWLVILWVLPNG